jgi:hypothetical protein
MDISCRREGPLTIVDMSGRWSIGPGEIELRALQEVMARLIATGRVQPQGSGRAQQVHQENTRGTPPTATADFFVTLPYLPFSE